VQIYNF